MLNRAFTKREKILMIVVAVILLGLAYYKFLIVDVNNVLEKYDVTAAQEEYDIAEAKATSIKNMEAEMVTGKESGRFVPSYNNTKQLIKELNNIIGGTSTYNISFEDPVKEGNVVRRNASISFSTTGFDSARQTIKAVHDCKYRCLIRELSLTSGSNSTGVTSGSVSVNMSVTFFETMYGANSDAGFATGEEAAAE